MKTAFPFRYRFPADPQCPPVKLFAQAVYTDPFLLSLHPDGDLLRELFERRHRLSCDRCRKYGAEHVQVAS